MIQAAAITFALCLAIVLGAYWAFIVRPEESTIRKLRKRLKNEAVTETVGRDGLTKRPPPLSALKGLDALLGRSGKLLDPMRRTIDYSALPVTLSLVVLGMTFSALLTYLL